MKRRLISLLAAAILALTAFSVPCFAEGTVDSSTFTTYDLNELGQVYPY